MDGGSQPWMTPLCSPFWDGSHFSEKNIQKIKIYSGNIKTSKGEAEGPSWLHSGVKVPKKRWSRAMQGSAPLSTPSSPCPHRRWTLRTVFVCYVSSLRHVICIVFGPYKSLLGLTCRGQILILWLGLYIVLSGKFKPGQWAPPPYIIAPVVFESPPLCSNHPRHIQIVAVVLSPVLPLLVSPLLLVLPLLISSVLLVVSSLRILVITCPPPACLTPPPPPARFTPPPSTAGLASPRCHLNPPLSRPCSSSLSRPPPHCRLFPLLSPLPLPPPHRFLPSSSSSRPSSLFLQDLISSWWQNQRR